MRDEQKGAMVRGFSLLWRRQRVLWWIFVVNLLCAAIGTVPGFLALHRALGNNLAGRALTNRFDVGMFVELIRVPESSLWRFTTTSYLFAFVFMVFMLFVTGGILETYRQDRRLTIGEFLAASGTFFWPFVRLLLLSIIPFIVVSMIYQASSKFADHVGDRAIADQVGIFLSWGAMLVFLLLALWVRLWFDLAQVRAVVQNDRRMWRNMWSGWRITWQDFGALFWMYFGIAIIGWIALVVGLLIWSKLPPTATIAVLLILELIIFAQVATRLWQLASAMTWYKGHAELVPPPAVVELASVPAQEVVTAAPVAPPADSGPELPPADA